MLHFGPTMKPKYVSALLVRTKAGKKSLAIFTTLLSSGLINKSGGITCNEWHSRKIRSMA